MLQWRFPMLNRRMNADSVSEDRFRLAFVAVVKKSGLYRKSTSIRTTCFAIRGHVFRRFRPSNRYHNRVSIYVVGNEPGWLTDLIITANRMSYLFFMSAYSKTPPRDWIRLCREWCREGLWRVLTWKRQLQNIHSCVFLQKASIARICIHGVMGQFAVVYGCNHSVSNGFVYESKDCVFWRNTIIGTYALIVIMLGSGLRISSMNSPSLSPISHSSSQFD